MIPKQIHYLWFGSEIPDKVSALIRKNASLLVGYKITLWQESNIDQLSSFAARAYEEKRWAFVSDYLRFKILYEQGGVYLDTDMEVLRPIDNLLAHDGFAGLSKDGDYIYCGIIGVIPRHPLIKKILAVYDALSEGSYPTSPEIFTRVFKENKSTNFSLYEYRFFYPVQEGETTTPALLLDAYTTHHWHESWRSLVRIRRIFRRLGLIHCYHRIKKIFKQRKIHDVN